MTIPLEGPKKPIVVSLYHLEPAEINYAKQYFDFVTPDDPRSKNWKHEANAIMVRSDVVSPQDVEECGPQLRYVAKHGVGVNQIAVKELAKRGILVMNSPGVNAGAVAELALTLMLALARNVCAIDRRVRSGMTVSKNEEGAIGIQLFGRSFGIVGGGNIGYYLAKMLRGAFEAKIYLYDPVISDAQLKKWVDLVPHADFHRVTTIGEMLPHIDVLSLHVPLLDSTRDLINEDELRMMRPHSILVNTARGGVVNEKALLKALDERWIAAAGIDAYEIEPPTLENYAGLISSDRVISLPHIGAASLDVIATTARVVIDHLKEAFSGLPPRDVVQG